MPDKEQELLTLDEMLKYQFTRKVGYGDVSVDEVFVDMEGLCNAQVAKLKSLGYEQVKEFAQKDLLFIRDILHNLVDDVREKDFEGAYFSKYDIVREVEHALIKYFVPDVSHKEWARQNGYEQVWEKCPGWQGEKCGYDKKLQRYVVTGWDSMETCPTCKGTGKVRIQFKLPEGIEEKIAKYQMALYCLGKGWETDDWDDLPEKVHEKYRGEAKQILSLIRQDKE